MVYGLVYTRSKRTACWNRCQFNVQRDQSLVIAIGFFANKFHSLPLGILFGLAVGALLAYLTARFAVGVTISK